MDVESGDKAINLPNFCHSFSPTHLYHLITFFLTFLYVVHFTKKSLGGLEQFCGLDLALKISKKRP
jgi:hypothetical protein